ncbi:CRISPR-associated endonuclease Cas3'' [Edaphobacter aggregans]|uniref:CRISPR-associated endonuclease Cas3'' n=1 Tax=Edaphobacter aggregans TaxID=570835 RepID=UPI00068B4ADB|nr:CRISPR-associated endonuclease Cas3'' [Edaphobacter aggregans]
MPSTSENSSLPALLETYAHTLRNSPRERWEPLLKHLEDVAALCASYAAAFHASDWGWVAGRCHDLGKASAEFQAYLCSSNPDAQDAGEESSSAKRVDHSTFGARYVASALPGPVGRMLAFCIAGHHAGLADGTPSDDQSSRRSLSSRLNVNSIPHVDPPQLTLTAPPLALKADNKERSFALAFFTRMIFSCLVDADRTCTEAFCDPDKAQERAAPCPSLHELRVQLDSHLDAMQQNAPTTAVNEYRRAILAQCLQAAAGEPGFYSLQVPTGGGKTLSSLAFALRHAPERMRRVVVAIPFTSIIEQTADTYRKALGPYAERGIIEHHSNVLPEQATRANQMATENWDAPLIVTTNVQLFESLFAASTTPCRKLHRLANSVIILDEAQTLPVELLEPTLRALQELVRNYGCTVVLCTATQPALEHRQDFPIGLKGVTPIIANPAELFKAMRRVRVEHAGQLTDETLAIRLAAEAQVLCIVNTRKHAARLFDRLSKQVEVESVFHLSTLMCGEHRRNALKQIRQRLKAHLPCRVVSTQLIEAGVDIDVPVVYRAAAGFDSIAQAAGRCNREGSAPMGTTYVFDAEVPPPPGLLRQGSDKAKELWNLYRDPLAPAAVEHYFRLLYWQRSGDWDKHGIMQYMALDRSRPDELAFQFRTIEERFRLICDAQLPILVPYDETARDLISALERSRVDYAPNRKLQPYLVSIPENSVKELKANGVVRAHESGIWVLLREDAYTPQKGLTLDSIALDAALWGV